MKRKIIYDISASSIQVIINQFSGILFFYILSAWFSKSDFGDVNWSLAVLMVVFAILGFGIDQVTVRKIAAGNDPSSILPVYLFHVLFTGILCIILIALAEIFAGPSSPRFNILLLLAVGQLLLFIAVPFKQIANGKEEFRVLLLMSTGANILKVAGLIIIAWMGRLSLSSFTVVYIIAAAVELMVCMYLGKRKLRLGFSFVLNRQLYKALIKESLPQLGVVICNSAIARVDWILLGIISTSSILAEYSFAYKAFELSTLPLLILAPLLLPKITKWFNQTHQGYLQQKKEELFILARVEIILASFGTLVLNIIWSPIIDGLTNNKYGVVNAHTILILSCCVPFLYVNNILWAVNFVQGRMKLILSIFIVTLLVNCSWDLLLIPFFNAEGAAIAYLAAIMIQTIYFLMRTQITNVYKLAFSLGFCIAGVLISLAVSRYASERIWAQLITATGIYTLLMLAGKQIRINDWFVCKKLAWQ